MTKVVAHCLIKNEARWIWFALMSVIDYADAILVWDTGSTDRTVEIVKTISSPKIKFRQYGAVDEQGFTTAHQQMLNQTQTDWLLWLDGDEIWPRPAIAETVTAMKKNDCEFLVNRYYNLIGDVYHYQEPAAGRYKIGPYQGHISIRAINLKLIPGLHVSRPHGRIGMFDQNGVLIQDRKPLRSRLMRHAYLHATHLHRSTDKSFDSQVIKRQFKFKYELGIPFAPDFSYPQVFFLPRPDIVPDPWERRSWGYIFKAAWQSPVKWLRRRLVQLPSGY